MSIGEILCFRVYLTNRAYDPGQENQSSQKKSLKKVCQVVSFNLSKSTAEVPLLYE